MAAEITSSFVGVNNVDIRFNEAAANGRGNPDALLQALDLGTGFNEAAANGRGNLQQVSVGCRVQIA